MKAGPFVPFLLAGLAGGGQVLAEGMVSRPLAPPKPAQGATLFVERPAAALGLDFLHRWNPPTKYAKAIERSVCGAGVALGDYDGDGRPDVFLPRPFGGGQLYRNLGAWRFENVTSKSRLGAETGWGVGASFADVDNDGDLDLYVCGFDCPNRLHRNNGDGTFSEVAGPCGLDFSGASVMAAFADFDNDGDLDLYLLTSRALLTPDEPQTQGQVRELAVRGADGQLRMPSRWRERYDILTKPDGEPVIIETGQADHLFRNDGVRPDGTVRFIDVTEAAGVLDFGQGLAATWWDYDRDGWPDLYVANDFFGADRLFHNERDGTFKDVAPALLPHTPWFSMGCDVADLNNDGWLDFMASDMAGSTHYKDKMGMGDMESKGWFLETGSPRQYMRNAVYLNSGAGPFLECAHLLRVAGTDWTWSVKFGDLDCDGRVDLYVTNGMSGDFLNSDYTALKAAGASPAPPPAKRDRHLAFRNRGDLAFENVGQAWGLDREAVSFGAAYGDLDGDGDLDLIVNNFNEAPSVYENGCLTGQRLSLRLRGEKSNRWGVGALVTLEAGGLKQTQYLTLARGFASQDEPLLHFGLAGAQTIDHLTIRWPSGIIQELTGLPPAGSPSLRAAASGPEARRPVSLGQMLTITEPSTPSPSRPVTTRPPFFRPSPVLARTTHTERPFDDFRRQPLLPNRYSQLGPGMAWADVNGDGRDDFYLGRAAGGGGMVYLDKGRDPEGRPRLQVDSFAPFDQDKECEDMGVLFFEADGDGDQDLLVVSGGVEGTTGPAPPGRASAYQDRLYLGDGRGHFSKAPPGTLPADADSGSGVCAADVDRDGDLDLFIGGRVSPGEYPLSPGCRLLRNEAGKFFEATAQLAPALARAGLATAAVWSDLNIDGWPDLVIATEWGPVHVFINESGRLVDRTGDSGTAPLTGWWNGLEAADLDHDGRLDLIATNFGLNTKYHPSADHPQRLYYGDFDGSGVAQVVEAKTTDDGSLLPVRGKSCSQNAMPFLKEKFPKFHDFALATLDTIYTPEKLATARQFEATTLETGIFWNETPMPSAGTPPPLSVRFRFQPLPRLAQIAPAFGVVAIDVNLDGHRDLVLAQNFFGPQRETGRMDGGLSLLLLGDGKRGFTPVWPDESGLVVPADAKSLTVADLNGDDRPDLVFGINDGALMAFENAITPHGRRLVVRLAGLRGNPTAIGARITLKTSSGSTQTAEIHAGSGYLSQSQSRFDFAVPDGGTASSLDIRWPDGHLTTRELTAEDAAGPVSLQP